MERFNNYFVTLLIWLLGVFLVLGVSGCGSVTSKEDPKESGLVSPVENISHSSTNIGLTKENKNNSKSPFISIPKEISINENNETIFNESLALKSQQWAAEGWNNMKRGAVDGAKWGFGLGTNTCAAPATLTAFSIFILSGIINPNDNAIKGLANFQTLLCGVAMGSVSSVSGGVLGPVIYPFDRRNDLEEFSFIRQMIVQTTWENLIKMGHVRQSGSFQKNDDLSMNNGGDESFEFGSNKRPFDHFIEIEPIQFRFIHVPFWASEQLTLRIVTRIKFFDRNKDVLFKERIQIDKGPYTLVEWPSEKGVLLDNHMEKAYQELAEQIVASIQENNTFLLNKFKASH